MNISKDIRKLLRAVAKGFAEIDGVAVQPVHFVGAMNHVAGVVRQEFDHIFSHGLFDDEPEETTTDPAAAEPTVQPDPDLAAPEQPAEPAPASEAAPPTETAPAAEPATEPAAAEAAPAEPSAEPTAEAAPASEQSA